MALESSLSSLLLTSLLLATPHSQDSRQAFGVARSASSESSGFSVEVIYTNLSGAPSSAVPGLPGDSFEPGIGTSHFDRVFGSPNGHWTLTADTDRSVGADEVLLVDDQLALVEGDTASWVPAELVGPIETKLGVNDAGEWVFATNTDGPTGTDEYLLKASGDGIVVVAQEGSAIPALADTFWGNIIESGVILDDGTVGLSGDSITGTGVTSVDNDILVQGATLLARKGITIPAGQIGVEAWDNFDLNDVWMSTDGSHWLAQGDLTGDTASDDIVAVDGSVVVQEGTIIAGSGFPSPVALDGIGGVFMAANADWYARGTNDDGEDWVLQNGDVLATVGSPIIDGNGEVWDDTDFEPCFFLNVASSNGHFVIGGVTDAPSNANGVLVLDATYVVAREGDPIDLDGNGAFDDDTFFDTFGNDDAFLATDGELYVVATIRDGTETRIGQGFFVVDLSFIASIFADDFESSDTTQWSDSLP